MKIVPSLDRSDLVHFTTHTVLHNLTEGIILVAVILLLFLGKCSRAPSSLRITIPFALLFASICLELQGIPANLLSLGALDFGMVVDGAVVMVENIVRTPRSSGTNGCPQSAKDQIREAAHEVQRPGLLRHRDHHYRLSAHLHSAARGGPAVSGRWPGLWLSRFWVRSYFR